MKVNRNWKKEAKVSDRVLRARSTSLTTADIKRPVVCCWKKPIGWRTNFS